jgi:hypothetical protein
MFMCILNFFPWTVGAGILVGGSSADAIVAQGSNEQGGSPTGS